MTEDDKEFLKEFLRGLGGASIVFLSFCMLCVVVIWTTGTNTGTDKEQSEPNHGTYTVVSKYKGCDVVQWHYGPLAEYKYFLHCNNTRPVYE